MVEMLLLRSDGMGATQNPRRSRRQGLLRWMVRGKQSLVLRQGAAETTKRGAWVPTRRFYEQSPANCGGLRYNFRQDLGLERGPLV
jgi:hypothetical protein